MKAVGLLASIAGANKMFFFLFPFVFVFVFFCF